MRIELPPFSIDPGDEWTPDEATAEQLAAHGLYLRSNEHGIYMNVRVQSAGAHPLTRDGLVALLREQAWASAPFDEWVSTISPLTIVGGTFETVGMNGEVVLEVFLTDGRLVVNLAGPGERATMVAVTPSVQRLASTVRFTLT